MTDFTAHVHPVLAVACPDCGVRAGAWCKRPSEHKAQDLHAARKREADRVFIEQHGERASIDRTHDGWVVDPDGLAKMRDCAGASAAPNQSMQADLFEGAQ